MTDTPTFSSPDTRLATIARLNDRCRQGLDRTARILITRACLGTFADNRTAEIVAQAEILSALRGYQFREAEADERDRAVSNTGVRPSISASTITMPRWSTVRRIPPTPVKLDGC